MKIRLTITKVEDIQEGTSQSSGNKWRKRNVLGNTVGNYPKMVCVEVWNDRCENQLLSVGNILDISFDLESREYKGRYYTTVKAYDFAQAQDAPSAQPMPKQDAVQAVQIPQVDNSGTTKPMGVVYPEDKQAEDKLPNYQDTTELPF